MRLDKSTLIDSSFKGGNLKSHNAKKLRKT
jgi:hypothetical protein